jgi:hypothetical protein
VRLLSIVADGVGIPVRRAVARPTETHQDQAEHSELHSGPTIVKTSRRQCRDPHDFILWKAARPRRLIAYNIRFASTYAEFRAARSHSVYLPSFDPYRQVRLVAGILVGFKVDWQRGRDGQRGDWVYSCCARSYGRRSCRALPPCWCGLRVSSSALDIERLASRARSSRWR